MGKIILSQEQIDEICQRLGKEISDTLRNDKKIPVIVGVLKGSMNFMMDLIKYIDIPMFTDYIQVSSYSGTQSTGLVQLLKDLSYDCSDRSVVIVEDVVDTGRSMRYLQEHIKTHHPKKIYVCALFNKQAARVENITVDFKGYELQGNEFLIGYGLDYRELERNLPYVYGATPEDVARLDKVLEEEKDYLLDDEEMRLKEDREYEDTLLQKAINEKK